jgi:hypothetical protein
MPAASARKIDTMAEGMESRRSSRIAARFWVAVEGVDAEPFPRVGDISATGIFFEVDSDVGEVGTVQWLHIASHDRTRTVHVMAYVVRVVSIADVHRQLKGVALEFMPESDEAAAQLCDFVRYILDRPQADGSTPHIAPRVEARAIREGEGATEEPAKLAQLSVRTLLLETDWSVPVGEPIRIEIIARGVRRPVRVEGQTVSVLPAPDEDNGKKRYRIAVRVNEEIDGPLRRFTSRELRAPDSSMIASALQREPRSERTPKPGSVESSGRPSERIRAASSLLAATAEPRARTGSPLEPLLSALIQPAQVPAEREHLSGLLSRIPFSALCSLLELERLTGEVRVRRGDEQTTLYVREGRIIDVTSPRDYGPRREIAKLLQSRDGKFDLVVVPVMREDRIKMSMTQLLLDSAQEVDETRRPDGPS